MGAMVRATDSLGRVVLPADLLRAKGIAPGDLLDLALEGDQVVLARHVEPGCCVLCGAPTDLPPFRGLPVCGFCRGLAAHRLAVWACVEQGLR